MKINFCVFIEGLSEGSLLLPSDYSLSLPFIDNIFKFLPIYFIEYLKYPEICDIVKKEQKIESV